MGQGGAHQQQGKATQLLQRCNKALAHFAASLTQAMRPAEDDDVEEEAAPKTVKKTVWDWEVLNDNKAIWLRPSTDVSETEYDSFYKAISKVLAVLLS